MTMLRVQFVHRLSSLGFPWPNRLFWPDIRLGLYLRGDGSPDIRHWRGCTSTIYCASGLQDQDDYQGALNKLHFTITRALAVNPSIHLEVFIHKVDTLTTDYQQGTDTSVLDMVDNRYKTGYSAAGRGWIGWCGSCRCSYRISYDFNFRPFDIRSLLKDNTEIDPAVTHTTGSPQQSRGCIFPNLWSLILDYRYPKSVPVWCDK